MHLVYHSFNKYWVPTVYQALLDDGKIVINNLKFLELTFYYLEDKHIGNQLNNVGKLVI